MTADAIASVVGLFLALALRFEGAPPAHWADAALRALPILVACRVGANASARLHLWSFRLAGLAEATSVASAALAGTALFYALSHVVVPGGLPRSVYALEFFFSLSAFGLLRYGPRLAHRWLRQGARLRAGAAPTLIIGVEEDAELLARDLLRNSCDAYRLVGFVCEDAKHVSCERIGGKPILGTLSALPAIVARHQIGVVMLADPGLSAARIRTILDLCANAKVRFKIVPASPARDLGRPSVATLNDVAPEDLLPRAAVEFDEDEIRALVQGKRALVTGAAGSIGGEISRQLAHYGVKQLVLVDMNENELYLGARRLAREFPHLAVHAEVADVREPGRIFRLGERYRPQNVFHAAAHKHVPLMEDAPEEAVKNNVFGTLHVARMAIACGAERFVLISTDKAVKPTSVMGTTKRVAELVVRDLAGAGQTQMTCVRFGNVLGSAGSVVPLFREQIARGGPITVTHPDCARFFMTVREAVGLVLLAGLGGYGEVCVLEMGEAIRIADLARNMITLAGHVPDVDMAIEYTGLRPGEKLYEEVLTEEEERSQAVRDRIRATVSPAPPAHLHDALRELRTLSEAGDEDGVLEVLASLVPTYRVTRNGATRHSRTPTCIHERREPLLTPSSPPVAQPMSLSDSLH